MMIFQRMVTFQAPPQEVVPWAVDMTALVSERTHLDVSLWQGLYGGPLGTLAWTARIDNLTALEVATDALGADADYLAHATKARDWGGVGEDRILRVMHIAGGAYVRPGVGAYAEGTACLPAEGKMREAAAFGVEISDRHAELTHASVLFGASSYGPFGQVVWLGLHESAAEVDRAAEVISKDEGYAAAIDGAGGLFQPGSATRTLARRIA